jgi:hypothetical protein
VAKDLLRFPLLAKHLNRRGGCPVPRTSAEREVLSKLDQVTRAGLRVIAFEA